MPGSIANYLLFLDKKDLNDNIAIIVDLFALLGNPDLYVKSCMDAENCFISENDIVNAEKLSDATDNFFIYSTFSAS